MPAKPDDTASTTEPEATPAAGRYPNAPMVAPEPDPGPTIDETADSTGTADNATLDSDLLNGANGDASVWGAEFGRFLAALTGSHIDDGSLTAIFGAYAAQVQGITYRQAALAVANSPIANTGQTPAVLIAQMDLRGDIAEYLLQTVGA